MTATFHGTPAEAEAVIAALERGCDGPLQKAALLGDQRFLDGVLAYRHMAATLRAEEWKEAP